MTTTPILRRRTPVAGPLVAAAAVLLLAGCAQEYYPPHPPLGNATLHNAAVHVVDPEPPVHEDAPDLAGTRARLAIDRYHRARTIRPEDVDTGGTNN